MVLGRSRDAEENYNRKKESFIVLGVPFTEEILFYNSYSGATSNVLWKIVKRHFNPFKNHDKRSDYGKGVYFFSRPDPSKVMKPGVLCCKVLTGKKFYVNDPDDCDLPNGYHSKYAEIGTNTLLAIQEPSQILPLGVVHCGRFVEPILTHIASNNGVPETTLTSEYDKVSEQMSRLFENSLKLHATGKHMKACEAITTPLYPHQMYALAWMSSRENSKVLKMRGGILADDMGLGKTLTVLSLIMTNFHDGRPLQKPVWGFQRRPSKSVAKYMPHAHNAEDKTSGLGLKTRTRDLGRRKDARGKIKGSKRRFNEESNEAAALVGNAFDEMEVEENGEKDEFDDMIGGQDDSLSKRLGIGKKKDSAKL